MDFDSQIETVTTYSTDDGKVYTEDQVEKKEQFKALGKVFNHLHQARKHLGYIAKERWSEVNESLIEDMYSDWKDWPWAWALRGTGKEGIRVSKGEVVDFLYNQSERIQKIQPVSEILLQDIPETEN